LNEKYIHSIDELERQTRLAANALLQAAGELTFQIDLGDESLLVGEFEPLLNGYPLLDSIQIGHAKILVHVELNDGYQPLEDFTTFSFADKLAILEVIESQIEELMGSLSDETTWNDGLS
jgi:hypothetical protein